MKTRLAILAAASILLNACAGAVTPWSKQDYVGINRVEIRFTEEGLPEVDRIDGKGRGKVSVEFSKEGDKLWAKYTADDITVTGTEIRGAVEQAAIEGQIEIAPDALSAISDAVCRLVIKVPC